MAVNFSLPFPGGGGIGIGGGIGLPPLQLSSSASSGMDQSGGSFGFGAGDWSVNMAGSGTSLQAASGGINWLLIAAGVAAWYLLRK
jgi:hypothetical protein